MRKRFIALIPAYEPDEKIKKIADELLEKGFDIVVVDDGSGPDYAELFDELSQNLTVLTHTENRGKGAALKTGMRYINIPTIPPRSPWIQPYCSVIWMITSRSTCGSRTASAVCR